MPLAPAKNKSSDKYQADAAPTSPSGSNTYIPGTKKHKFDESEYVTYRCAVFDQHNGKEEGVDIDFTPEVLVQMATACNQRYQDTGDAVPVTDRHTTDEPGDQPDILGWATDFEVDDLGNVNRRKAIYANLHIFKDKIDKAKNLPRRSVEIWPDGVIDPVVLQGKPPVDSIALLGAERPARDLGLMKNQKAKTRYRYELQDVKEPMNPEDIIKKCVEAIQSLPEFAYIHDCMAKQEAKVKPTAEQYAEEEAKVETKSEDEDTNEAAAKADEEDENLEPAKLRMQRDQERRKYHKLESDYKALFAKVAELERKERVSARKADLLGLEGEGVVFDIAEELDIVSDMEPVRYSKHLNHMRKRYQKAPIGVNIKPAAVPAEGGSPNSLLSPEKVAEAAIQKAQEKYKK